MSMKWQVDRNGNLIKWQDNDIASQWYGKLTKCQVDAKAIHQKWQFIKMERWQNDKLMKNEVN
jgi:hypothetical protein